MSAGKFTKSKYGASYGAGTQIHPIRVQPETIAADFGANSNDPPDGAINNPISALISRGARQRGLQPRSVTLKLKTGEAPPTGYDVNAITRIPVLTKGAFDALADGGEVTYLGKTWVVGGKHEEKAD